MKFSKTEIQHLLKAWVAISLAFAILQGNIFSVTFLIYFAISLITVGIGFLLHELAHKLVAQRYGCFAEFRADNRMLIFAILSSFLGFVFAAPGAVMIEGHVSTEKSGKISIAGPAANIVLALIFLGFSFLFKAGTVISATAEYGFQINAFIALFNLIPVMNFDGEKIIKWNKLIYFSAIAVAGFLVILPHLPVV